MADFYDSRVPRRTHSGFEDIEKTIPGMRDRKSGERFAAGCLIMNRYKVLAELGQGGMGVVYRCLDETAGIQVALKALPPELSHNTLEMEDIKENFQLVAKLVHQNIAISKQLEKDPVNGNYYLIMECCDGEDLRRWIRRKRRDGGISIEEVIPVIRQVAGALDYAHEMLVMHRDIKPGNIMIDQYGRIKVLDFGLAAQIHTSMTRVSMAYHGTSGTGPYMAPEQWQGRAQGAAADQYALAVMAYEMLAGHLPFESTDPAVLQQAVLTQEPEDISGISPKVRAALKRAMSKRAAERFGSCSDFAAALSGKKVKTTKKRSGNSMKWFAAATILFLFLMGGIGYYKYDSVKKERAQIFQKISDNLEQARYAKKQSQWSDVLRFTKMVLQLDADNAAAKSLQNEAKQQITILLRREEERRQFVVREKVYSMQREIQRKKAEIGLDSIDRGQSFGKHINTLLECAATGDAALKNNDIHIAFDNYKRAVSAADWIIANLPLRNEAQLLRKQLAVRKAEAEKLQASVLVDHIYSQAYKYEMTSNEDFDTGKFASAIKALKNAIVNYKMAGVKARESTVKQLYTQAEAALQAQRWNEVFEISDKIRVYDTTGANKLVKSVNERKKLAQVNKILASANEAKNSGKWNDVYKFALDLQAVDPGNKDAEYLLKEAEPFCEPSLEIVAKINDLPVAAQLCWEAGRVLNTGSQISSLPKQNILISVFTTYNDSVYYTEVPLTCNWKGPKKISVQLNKADSDVKKFKETLLKALKKDAAAQNSIGYNYSLGQGVAKNHKKEVYWYRKAADQGNPMAQCNLGICYENGQGVDKDPAKAFSLYMKAAEQNNSSGQFFVGLSYKDGNGIGKDPVQAVYWFRKAAAQGNVKAMRQMGICYEFGHGVAKDPSQAVVWYRKSAEKGYKIAQYNLANCYSEGVGVAEDKSQAIYWYRKAAEQNHADSQNCLGYFYENGYGIAKDLTQAVYWYRKSAENGEAVAQCNLGYCYQSGRGIEKDFAQAVYWYRKAAENGNARGQNNLAVCYQYGNGVSQDYYQAVHWYRKAAEQNYSAAENSLGVAYYNGNGVNKDRSQAVYWFRRSAEHGNRMAQCNLGECYRDGDGTGKDLDLARYWFTKSMEQGYEKARKNLKRISDL